MRVLVVLVALAMGCGGTTGPADRGTSSSSGGGNSSSGSSGGATSGGATSGGTTSGGSTSGGTTVTTTPICKIATLGFKGQWGEGNVFTDWLQTQSTQGTTALGAEILTPALLAPFQVIVVQDVRSGGGQPGVGQGIGRTFTADEVEALRAWIANGGGLMTLIGYAGPDEITNVNLLLAPSGLSYGSQSILQGGGGYTAPVTHWASDHPIAAGITKVGVDNGYPVLGGGTLIAWEPTQGQYDAGRAIELGSGRVFAWMDEWITYNSEWTGKPDYQVAKLWANALTWLKGSSTCQVPLPPGEW